MSTPKPRKTRSKTTAATRTPNARSAASLPARRRAVRRDRIAAVHAARAVPEPPGALPYGPIDFGQVRNAACDVVIWALDLAENDVRDWPEARQRVRRVRRALLDTIRGRRMRGSSIEDVVFTTQLLVRIFEYDLGVDMGEIALLIDALGLPVEEVPIVRRPQRATRVAPTVAPDRVPVIPLRMPVPRGSQIATQRAPDPDACQCDLCRLGYRNAT